MGSARIPIRSTRCFASVIDLFLPQVRMLAQVLLDHYAGPWDGNVCKIYEETKF